MDKRKKAAPAAQSLTGQDKDKHFETQYQIVYQSFKECPKTMLQVSLETGILRANICRYIDDMKDKGLVQEVRKGRCPYTHYVAGYYSTDPRLFVNLKVQQPTLFDYGI